MLSLSGILNAQTIRVVREMTADKFKDHTIFKTPESVVLYEQGYLNRDELFRLCSEQYEEVLSEPQPTFVPSEVLSLFHDSNAVPIQYKPNNKEVVALYIPEYQVFKPYPGIYNVVYVPTTLHYYIMQYTRHYGLFKELLPISGKAALDMILEEAIKNNIPDLTISSQENRVIVYYNNKKRKEMSNNIFPGYIMGEIIKVLTIGTPIADETDNKAKYVGYEIDKEYRARVVINNNVYGHAITMRLLSRAAFNKTLDDLNINCNIVNKIREFMSNRNNGLRLVVGETMSGKNTTTLAILKEIVDSGNAKVVSVEMPVEQVVLGIEQIGNDSIDEYISNIQSLIHQNPDYVYITETNDQTGQYVMKVANTGKRVFTTLHSNSVSDTISRITDITGMSVNRVIQVLHSILYQELIRIGDEVYPYTRFVYFDDDFKQELYDKSFGEVIRMIKDREVGGLKDELL